MVAHFCRQALKLTDCISKAVAVFLKRHINYSCIEGESLFQLGTDSIAVRALEANSLNKLMLLYFVNQCLSRIKSSTKL